MTVSELNEQVLSELGVGNAVAPCESLKTQLVTLLSALDRHDQGEGQTNLGDPQQIDNVIDGLSDELDALLAVGFPLIEYGSRTGQNAVARALARIAREVDRDTRTPGWGTAMLAISARLLWATTAFALSCGALDLLPRLMGVASRSRYEDRDEPLLVASPARYLDAYQGDAAISFESHQRWLEGRGFIAERYPLLARDDELSASLMEADLIFAAAAALSGATTEPYSHGAHREGRPAETRLRAHAAEPKQRSHLCAFFGLDDGDLETRLNELYATFRRRPGMWFGETSLFPTQPEQS